MGNTKEQTMLGVPQVTVALLESQGLREGNSVDASNSVSSNLAMLSLLLARPAFPAAGDEGQAQSSSTQ